MIFQLMFTVPFNPFLSKNRKLKTGRGRVYVDPKHRAACMAVETACARAMCEYDKSKLPRTKTFIRIHTFKPDNRSDCVNLIDGICDAISTPLGVNDRWFSAMIDWEIDRTHPRVEVRVYSLVDHDQKVDPKTLRLVG